MSGTTWNGRAAMRISVVGFRTSVEDVDRTLAAVAEAMDATAGMTTDPLRGGQLAS